MPPCAELLLGGTPAKMIEQVTIEERFESDFSEYIKDSVHNDFE